VDIRQSGTQVNGFCSGNPLLSLNPATQACMIYHEHFNSSQSYLNISLMWVRNQRLEEALSVFAFGGKGLCTSFTSKAVLRTEPDKGREYPKVVGKVTVKMEPTPKLEECQPRQRGFTRTYQGTWRWEPATQKYQQVAGNLDKLYKWYEQYY
jgi:hypothetical protein